MMKTISIGEMAVFNILNDDNVKLYILREKWEILFSDMKENSLVVNFKNNVMYIKNNNSTLNHYIFSNKEKIIGKILENLDVKFEIEDIKII